MQGGVRGIYSSFVLLSRYLAQKYFMIQNNKRILNMIPHFQDDASSTQRLEGVTSSKLTKVSKVSPDGSSKVIVHCNL